MRLPAHEATTAQLCAAYPFVARPPLPGGGVLVGRERSGGAFVHDPFELYRLGVLTNPNLLVLGQIGRGKSAFVKSYLYRQAAFGRRIVVIDPKGEYGPLAAALGVVPVALRPGGSLRLNPLELGGGDEGERRCLVTLAAVAAALVGRALRPLEHALLEQALAPQGAGPVRVIATVVDGLLDPPPATCRALRSGEEELRREGRDLALSLRRLVAGDLAGLFDAPTSPEVDLGAAAVVLDLSALYQSSALGVAIVCVQAVLEAATTHGHGPTLLVMDEAWALFANLATAQFLQASLKLARARGVANVLVTHRLSDLAAGAPSGSATARLVEGLVADCETVVAYAQPDSEIPLATRTLGLSGEEGRLLPHLRRGTALWRVGGVPYLVEHRLAAAERALVDTDAAMSALAAC
ncbi:MAG TPA: ATP-binding protein [Acidimicrobiales bacterium]|nr:ATP-binding protein [Acidimicrobiales bacterium]